MCTQQPGAQRKRGVDSLAGLLNFVIVGRANQVRNRQLGVCLGEAGIDLDGPAEPAPCLADPTQVQQFAALEEVLVSGDVGEGIGRGRRGNLLRLLRGGGRRSPADAVATDVEYSAEHQRHRKTEKCGHQQHLYGRLGNTEGCKKHIDNLQGKPGADDI